MTNTTPNGVAEALNYRRAAINVLGKDTVKGRIEQETRQSEVTMVACHLAGEFFPNDPQARDEFLNAAGVTA